MNMDYTKRFFKEPKQSFFLFGPRGTGKSTLIRRRFPNALVIDLLNPDTRRMYAANPEKLLDVVRAEPEGKAIFIDEIQKVPELLSVVHILIEEKKQWLFILTGSSARTIKRQGVDLLGGRALKKSLHPFMAIELKEFFNFQDALLHGLLPLRFSSTDPVATLSSYISLYLDEEVKAEGIVRNIEPFYRFLEALSFSHGAELSITNIASECMVKRTTVQSWMTIVEDLLIAFHLNVFKKRASRELTSHPKFYFFDTGVYRALRPKSLLDKPSEIDGAALEGLVAQHLRAWIEYTEEQHSLYFWRTRSGVEVDFILYGPLTFLAIEVKNSRRIDPKETRALEIFLEDYPEAKAIFLYRGKERMLIKDKILCLPCEEFLIELTPNKPPFHPKNESNI
jgi:predicted AAA+ superfamily ATPase